MSYPPEQNRAYLQARYRAQMDAWIERLGGRCVQCGSTDQLQFDHMDPATKSFTIGRLWSLKDHGKVGAELAKCQLLCAPCHTSKTAREHSERRTGTYRHGTLYAWQKKGCQCDPCSAVKWAWHDRRNARRRTGTRGPYRTRRT